jgi:hypothetical protein
MKALYDLKEKLFVELDEISNKPEMGAGDLELAHKLTDTIKNIDKICALEENGGYSGTYSRDGDWMTRGSYNRGSSYANRGKHYVRGHYSRDGYSNRGYSRGDSREHMMEQLENMMQSAGSEREKEAIQRCMDQLEQE